MMFFKRFAAVICAAAGIAGVAALSACSDVGNDGGNGGENSYTYTFAMPDGAPALAAAQLMAEDMQFGNTVNYSVVNASAIGAQVSGKNADVCILPVNVAAQFAGSGEDYKLLGTVTHGNLYMLSSEYEEEITADNLEMLAGKTVGCIQLQSFVGGVVKLILENNDMDYTVIEDVSMAQDGVVNLVNIADPTSISPSLDFDYMVAAEPLVTAKTSTGALRVVGNLQTIYGNEGYPQAVLVAKNSVISENPEFISGLCTAMADNAEWLKTADPAAIVAAINRNSGGATSTLNAKNLNATVISRCAINFVAAAECKEEVASFINGYSAVSGASLSVSDAFFFGA